MGLSVFENLGHSIDKGFAVFVVPKDLSAFNPSGHDVLQKIWRI
jgi:hypothetical protein